MGFVLKTVSPSSSIMSLSTPCVDGCCGPMLMIIVSSSVTSISRSPSETSPPSGSRRTAPISRRNSTGEVCSRRFNSCEPSAVPAWSSSLLAGGVK